MSGSLEASPCLLPFVVEKKSLHYNDKANRVPPYIRRSPSHQEHALLLKVTSFGTSSLASSPSMSRIDDDTNPGNSAEITRLMKDYVRMRMDRHRPEDRPINEACDRIRRSSRWRRPPSSELEVGLALSSIPLSSSSWDGGQEEDGGGRMSRYIIKGNARYIDLHLRQGTQAPTSAKSTNNRRLGEFKFPELDKQFSRTSELSRCMSCSDRSDLAEDAVPQQQTSDSLKQLALLFSPFSSERPEISCSLCEMKAMTWCPRCHKAYCFSCWDLVRHKNSYNSEDLLGSHFRALHFTDPQYINSASYFETSLRSRRSLSRSGLKSRVSSSRATPNNAPGLVEEALTTFTWHSRQQSPELPKKDALQNKWNEEFQDTLSTTSSSNGNLKHMISTMSNNLSTEIDPHSIHDADADSSKTSSESIRFADRDGMRVILPRSFEVRELETIPLSKSDSPPPSRSKMQVIRGKIIRTIDK